MRGLADILLDCLMVAIVWLTTGLVIFFCALIVLRVDYDTAVVIAVLVPIIGTGAVKKTEAG